MNLKHLEYFLSLSKTSSLSKTADELFTTHQNVGRILTQLEDELKTTLFLRSSKGLELTSTGEIFLPLATEIINKLHEYKAYVANTQHAKELIGNVEICSTPLLYLSFLSDFSYTFTKLFPNIQLTFKEQEVGQIFSDIVDNKQKIGVIPIMHNTEILNIYKPYLTEIHCHKLMQDQYLCYVHKSSPLADKKIVTVKEFLQYPLVFLDTSDNHPLIKNLKQYGDVNIAVRSNNSRISTKALLNPKNVGISTQMTHQNMMDFLSSNLRNEFVLIPFAEDFTFDISLIYKKGRTFNESELMLINYLKEIYYRM